jgi:hypothetical protein
MSHRITDPLPSSHTHTLYITPNYHKQQITYKALNADGFLTHSYAHTCTHTCANTRRHARTHTPALSTLQLQQQSDCHQHRSSARGIDCALEKGTAVTVNAKRGEESQIN